MKNLFLFLIALVMSSCLLAQVPQGFNYQAVARDNDGNLITEQSLFVRIGILQNEVLIWQEEHNITTNSIGLFVLTIGDPAAGGSGTAGTFAEIPWGTGVFTMKVDINDGSGYTDFEPQPLNAVPYALHAANGPVGPPGEKGDKGDKGDAPGHEWADTQLRFENPDGSWGTFTDLKGAQGEKGDKGDPGTGLTNRGDWVSGTTYNPGDYVFDDASADHTKNSMWILEGSVAYVSGTNPYLDPDHWAEFEAPEGPQGVPGPQGEQGPAGDPGPQGDKGDKPAHEWIETSLRFQNPDDTWGTAVDLRGEPGISLDNQELSLSGTDLSISGGNTISLAGLPDAVDDADADPANELQTLSIEGENITLSRGGGTIALPVDDVNDADADPDNEIQTLAIAGHTLSISEANSVVIPDQVNDADADPANEIQNLSISGENITLSNGGGTITLPPDDVNDADASPANEIQDLQYTGGILSLSADPTPTTVNLPSIIAGESGWDLNLDTVVTSNPVKILTGDDPQVGTPLFEVKNDLGNPVFAVFNDGVMVYVDEDKVYDEKGVKGGFAVGGYSKSTKGFTNEYLRVTPDSTRVYFKEEGTKGVKGGFAVGGYTNSKGDAAQLMSLTPENFLVGEDAGIHISTGYDNSFMGYHSGYNVTTGHDNIFLGDSSGYSATGAYQNIFIGNQSGFSTLNGWGNVFLGNKTGRQSTGGYFNSLIGYQAGYRNNSHYNSFLGFESGYNNTTGMHNIFIGWKAGYGNPTYGLTGNFNTCIGDGAGYNNTSGSDNVFLGTLAGYNNNTGNHNVFLGTEAGSHNNTGNDNVFLGYWSGYNNTSGDNNVFMGSTAGYYNTTGENNIFLGLGSGINNTVGWNNINIGNGSGASSSNGYYNTYIGYGSGYYSGYSVSTDPSYNTYIGYQTGYNNRSGQFNTLLGYRAGYSGEGASGSNNVMIGYDAGYSILSGSFNSFMGHESGRNNAYGNYNVFVGYRAGYNNNGTGTGFSGNYNVFMGYMAGYNNTSGGGSVIIGYNAATQTSTNNYVTAIGYCAGELSTGAYNVFMGGECGKQHGTGDYNAFYGVSSGVASNGSYNSYFGASSGWHNDGNYNTAVGYAAGHGVNTYAYYRGTYLGSSSGASQTTGNNNTFIGYQSGMLSTSGGNNVMLGYEAGYHNTTGSGNVFLGYQVGYDETTSNKLYIDNSSTSSPLVYGDFQYDRLTINGNVGIGTSASGNKLYAYDGSTATDDTPAIYGKHDQVPYYGVGVHGQGGYIGLRGYASVTGTGVRYGVLGYAAGGDPNYAVYAQGNLAYTGSLINASDAKFKKDVESLEPVMAKVMEVKPRKYSFIHNDNTKSVGLPESEQYGFVAQELELVFPELVVDAVHPVAEDENKDAEIHYKGVKYVEMIPILLKAIQEQQDRIELLEQRISELEK
ncbi:MAG: tail fiber domain-containing protein [Bacteroidales bacterium]|nr:tail fiber domain-containing protein [Bacteroidales bacterium]